MQRSDTKWPTGWYVWAIGLVFCLLGGGWWLWSGGAVVRAASPPPYTGNPHDMMQAPDRCAICHRLHTGGQDYLLATRDTSNAFCLTCHDGTGSYGPGLVSTHGNLDFVGTEASFSLVCTQCHNPHGSGNLYLIRERIRVTTAGVTNGPVVFTALTGQNSFDDGVSDPNSRLCVTCHISPDNPGYPMTQHTGGAGHQGGYDFTGQDCTQCHRHDLDDNMSTVDGFMPGGGCTICHSVAQDNGDGVPPGGRRAVVPEFSLSSHHVQGNLQDSDCVACHEMTEHKQGRVRLYNVDTRAVIELVDDPRTNPTEAAKLEPFCLACHDSDGAAGSAPFGDGVMPPVIDATAWAAAAHKNAGGATCFDCHDNGHGSNKRKLLAPYDATNDATLPDDPLRQEEGFCYTCHDADGPATTDVQTQFASFSHHPVAASDQAGGAKVECTDCHDPHRATSSQPLLDPDTRQMWSGPLTGFCLTCHDGSPPVGIAFTGGGAGPIISPHANADYGSAVEQTFVLECNQCHAPHGADNLALVLTNLIVQLPNQTTGPVAFTARTGTDSFDDGQGGTNERICTACHDDPNNPGYPMSNHIGGAGHGGGLDFTTYDCATCHPHDADNDPTTQDGFMPNPSCVGCHQFALDNGDGVPQGGRRAVVPDFSRTSHHIQGQVTDDDCKVCHDMSQHQQGQVRLKNVDTGAVIVLTGDPMADPNEAAKLEPFCLACHDGDGAAGSAPFSDGTMPPVIDATVWSASSHATGLTCFDCHANGHGSNKIGLLGPYDYTNDGDPYDPMMQEERFCYRCHDGTVATTDIKSQFAQASHHQVENDYLECINCHNPHQDNATYKTANPDNWYQPWTGAWRDFCLACHDGAPPTAANTPPPAVTFPATSPGTGYDKSAYLGSSHDNQLGAWGCRHCHDQHGSPYLATLLDNFVVRDYTAYQTNKYALCWTCHIEANVMSWRNRDQNHFENLHKKHVDRENAPCIICHDTHAPWDAGEPGLISFYVAANDTYDNYTFQFVGNKDLSSAFYIYNNATRGGCYVDCHNKQHNPKEYDRTNQILTYTCDACHPNGVP